MTDPLGFEPDAPLALASAAMRDPLADRRFSYARAAASDGAWQEAAELFEQTIELAPGWAAAWAALGDARARLGQGSAARDAYCEALARDPRDLNGATLKIAALGTGPCPAQAPQGYIKALFDEYAPRFDAHLTNALAYTAPQDLAAALSPLRPARFAHAIDLGCGTGLAGAAIRSMVTALTGIDLSPKMVEAARTKQVYDRLETNDILGFLGAEPEASADLILAADVFVYTGDLEPVFTQAARVLVQGGVLAFTLQRCDHGIKVGPDLRFAHSRAVVSRGLTTCGFEIPVLRDHSTRRENGRDVEGLLSIAVRA